MLEPQTNKDEEFSYVSKPSNPNILFAVPRPKVTTVTTTTAPVVRGEVLEEGGGGEEVVQKKVKIVEEYPAARPPERKTEDAYVRELENFIAPLLREALAPMYVTLGMIEQDSGKRQFFRFAGKDLSPEQRMTPIVWGCTTVKEFFKKNTHLGKAILIQLKQYINEKEDTIKTKKKKEEREEEEEEEEEEEKEEKDTKSSTKPKPSIEIRQDKKLLEKIKTLEESLEYLSDLLQEKLNDAETDVDDMRTTIDKLEKELAILQTQKELAIKAEKASGATTNIKEFKSAKNMLIGELVQLSKHEKDALDLLYPVISMNLVTVESAPSWLESQLSTKVLEFLLDKQAFGALNLAANELGYPLRDLVFSEEVNFMFAQFVSAKFVKPKSNAYASGTSGGEMQYRISSGAIVGQQQTTWVIGCKRWFKENVYYGNRELSIKPGTTSAEFRREAARIAKEFVENNPHFLKSHKKKYDNFLKAREDLIKLLPPKDAEKYRETVIVTEFTKEHPVAIPESANESFDRMIKARKTFFKDRRKYEKVHEQMLIYESYADIVDTRMLRVRKKN